MILGRWVSLLVLLVLASAASAASVEDGGIVEPGSSLTGLEPPSLLRDSPVVAPALDGGVLEGVVQLQLTISGTGTVTNVEVESSTDERLTPLARDAARSLEFKPATQNEQPIAVVIGFQFVFVAPAIVTEDAGIIGPTAEISGVVRTKGTREPIAVATVAVDGTQHVETDAEGRFTIRVPAGHRRVQVEATGFYPAKFFETLEPDQRVQVIYRIEKKFLRPYEAVIRGETDRAEVSRIQLSGPELREVAGTRGEPLRVIMLMPGVTSIASGISYPVIRGSVPAASGFFLEGVRIPQLFHMALGPSIVQPDFIDTIDFYPANAPARFGRLTGGVINATIPEPRDVLRVTASLDPTMASAYAEVPIHKTGTTITAAARISYTGWLLALIAQAAFQGKVTPVADLYDYQARVEQRLGKGSLRLLVFGSSDLVGARMADTTQLSPFFTTLFHRADLRFRYPLGPGQFEAAATIGTEDLGLFAELDGVRAGSFLMKRFLLSARAQWRVDILSNLQFRIAADIERQVAGIDNTNTIAQGADVFEQPRVMGVFSGISTELAWNPGKLALVGSVRVDSYHAQPGLQFWALEPRLNARFQFNERLTFKAGAGLYHQPPTLLLSLPISDLASLRDGLQETIQLSVGAEYRLPLELELSVEAYFNPMTRVLEKSLEEFVTGLQTYADLNPARRGRSYGIEVLLRAPPKSRFFGWLSYSLMRSERYRTFPVFGDTVDDVTISQGWLPFAFDQTHTFNLVAGYQLPRGFKVSGSLHIRSGRPESGEISSRTQVKATIIEGVEVWRPAPLNQVDRLPPFLRVDVRASKEWVLRDLTLELFLDFFNVSFSNEVYSFNYTREMAGTGQLGALKKESTAVPVVLPTLGLKGKY